MYAGRVVERAGVDELFARPAAPLHRRAAVGLAGARPARRHATGCRRSPAWCRSSPTQPDACTFADRCPAADAALPCTLARRRSAAAVVAAQAPTADHLAACWHPVGHRHRVDRSALRTAEHPMSRPQPTTGRRVSSSRTWSCTSAPVRAVDGVSLQIRRGQVIGPGRRERLGQVDGRPVHRPPARADGGHGPARRRRRHPPVPPPAAPAPPRRVDRLPGPGRLARPADARSATSSASRCGCSRRGCRGATAGQGGRGSSAGSGCAPRSPRRYPHELSGGQRQRVSIARALISAAVACWSPTSRPARWTCRCRPSVLNLLADLQRDLGLRLPVHHPRPVRRGVPRRRHRGDVPRPARRAGPARADLRAPGAPLHPGAAGRGARSPTRRGSGAGRPVLLGDDLPSALDPPSGCRFHTRCPLAVRPLRAPRCPRCGAIGDGDRRRCHLVDRRRHRTRRPHRRQR